MKQKYRRDKEEGKKKRILEQRRKEKKSGKIKGKRKKDEYLSITLKPSVEHNYLLL